MNFADITSLIGAVGFPIVVSWYLLTKLKDTIDKNTASNNRIANVLSQVCTKLGVDEKKVG